MTFSLPSVHHLEAQDGTGVAMERASIHSNWLDILLALNENGATMRFKTVIVLATLLTMGFIVSGFAENWPQWRGPHGTGVSSEKGIPVRWGHDENLAWKAKLGGVAVSSPIVWGDQIYVTSQLGRGVLRSGSHPTLARGEQEADERPLGDVGATPDDDRVELLVEAFQRTDGRRLWVHQFEAAGEFPELHRKHNMASPSPVTDGDLVYAWFGTGQLVALDRRGRLVWERHLGQENSPFDISWGHGSSPTLYRDLLILPCYHRPAAYLLALDKRTGEEVWRIDREKGTISYCTPFVVTRPEGDELIVNTNQRVDAHDPSSGKLLWHAGAEVRFAIPAPAYHEDVLYMSRGYRNGPYMALRVGGSGDVSETHVLWQVATGAPYLSSLAFTEGLIFMANGLGILTCVDAATGRKIWQERIGGIYSASPVVADGRVYFLNESGETVVLKAGREPLILERNPLHERTVASPAISEGQVFVRSDDHLFSIGKPSVVSR